MDDQNPRAVIGANNPPLADVLVDETAALKKRTDDLVASAGRAEVKDDDTAGRAVALVKMIRDHANAIEAAREERKKPFLDSGRAVDLHFGNLRSPLIGTDPKKLGGIAASVTALIDAFRRKKEEEAAAERLRLEKEAETLQAAADALKAPQPVDEVLGDDGLPHPMPQPTIESEAEALRLTAAASALVRQAQEVRAAPIVSSSGAKASGRKNWAATITDLTAALRHCRKVDEASILAAVQVVYDRQVRAGVRDLPGATVKEDSQTVIR